MRQHQVPLWLGAALVLLGCGCNVVIGDGSGAAAGQGGAAVTGGGGAGGGGPASLALVTSSPSSDSPCNWNPTIPSPPGAVFVLVASQPITCAQTLPSAISTTLSQITPGGGGPECVSNGLSVWEVCVPLPSSSLEMGTTDLTATAINAAEDYVSDSQEGCAFQQLPFNRGTLKILAVGTSSVHFTLAGTDQQPETNQVVTSDGTYTALRCP